MGALTRTSCIDVCGIVVKLHIDKKVPPTHERTCHDKPICVSDVAHNVSLIKLRMKVSGRRENFVSVLYTTGQSCSE